jgi:hypothetical protein
MFRGLDLWRERVATDFDTFEKLSVFDRLRLCDGWLPYKHVRLRQWAGHRAIHLPDVAF